MRLVCCASCSVPRVPQHLRHDLVLALPNGMCAADGGRHAASEQPRHAVCNVILQSCCQPRHEGHAWCEHVVGQLRGSTISSITLALALALAFPACRATLCLLGVFLRVRPAALPLRQALCAGRGAVDRQEDRLHRRDHTEERVKLGEELHKEVVLARGMAHAVVKQRVDIDIHVISSLSRCLGKRPRVPLCKPFVILWDTHPRGVDLEPAETP
mmetsp:Transcript_137954/g.384769  ORF Transcript_137954/g.384769 Transcript_137954/m.384769 type:complete len:214 (+) Transcript_137954:670-1311(+)